MSINRDIYIFDFDGVLCIPYTKDPYENVIDILLDLYEEGHYLFVASFNPEAKEILDNWNISYIFHDIRHGSNDKWDNNLPYLPQYKIDLAKSKQIMNMIQHIKDDDIRIYYYDDEHYKLEEVKRNFKHKYIECIHIVNGLQEKHVCN